MSMTWPVRHSPAAALRRWLPVAALTVVALVVTGRWWDPATPGARILGALVAAVALGFGARVLIPAGRLPWSRRRPVPRLLRRAVVAALVTLGVMVALLIGYAVTGLWVLPVAALAAVPVLWCCGFAETVGARLDDDAGLRSVLRDRVRRLRAALEGWWRAIRQELREAWTEPAERPGPADPSGPADDTRHAERNEDAE
jgi:hypothetical protein